MSDIVERLRHYASQMRPSGLGGPGHGFSPDRAPMLDEAADEIGRLRAEIELLHAELRVTKKLGLAALQDAMRLARISKSR